ncbi:MAG: hypothetical protein ACK4XY_10770 [Chloroherpetonaceae bacterium]
MNTKKESRAENEQHPSPEKQQQSERLQANTQRLLREQRDMARITTFGRRDE